MGFFQSIYDLADPSYRRARQKYEKKQANRAIADIQAQLAFREREDPREQAHLKQGLWGRGLGKSSIAQQDTDRLTFMQDQRRASINRAFDLARQYKRMIKKKHRYERNSAYAAMLDSIISLAAGAGGGGGQSPAQSGAAGASYGWSGGAGDYNYASYGGYA